MAGMTGRLELLTKYLTSRKGLGSYLRDCMRQGRRIQAYTDVYTACPGGSSPNPASAIQKERRTGIAYPTTPPSAVPFWTIWEIRESEKLIGTVRAVRVWGASSGTGCGRDAASKPTWMYIRRVPELDRQTQPPPLNQSAETKIAFPLPLQLILTHFLHQRCAPNAQAFCRTGHYAAAIIQRLPN